jgi:hypothetical protein
MVAGPGSAGRRRGCTGQGAQGDLFIRILDIQLWPGFQHRQIAQGARQILISEFALDAGGQQHIARMRHLDQRRGTEHSLHGPACFVLRPARPVLRPARPVLRPAGPMLRPVCLVLRVILTPRAMTSKRL